MAATQKFVTKKEQEVAKRFVHALGPSGGRLLSANGGKVRVHVGSKVCDVPDSAAQLFVKIMKDMASGKSVALVSSGKSIGTQQAAQILNVSRPHLVKLLESGKIPFNKVGTHRRIALQDVQNYLQNSRIIRKRKLDALTNQAQELNLGY